MKIYLKIFKDKDFGNCKTNLLLITTNKIKVSELKQIIFQKYGIEKSVQRLTTKLYNKSFIIMADEFPLLFFKIKEKSIIYVEILENRKKSEDILKKVKQREGKSKYLRRLNIFKKRQNMDVIQESAIEDIDDIEIKSYSLTNHTNTLNINIINESNLNNDYFNKAIEERFVNSIINNKIDEFNEIMKHYHEYININKPIGKMKKYSPIHFASRYEYCQMMEDLINKYYADVNLISLDGWSPLHISAYKGNPNIAKILISFKKTNYDLILPNLGTALHCACRKNNFKTAALLLHKCNPNLKDDKGVLPIDLTIDINIKKIINKTLNIFSDFEENINDISINRKIKSDGGIEQRLTKQQLIEFKFLKNLSYIPQNPSRFCGYIYKKGNIFSHYNLRYIEIDAIKKFFLRFFTKDDYPNKPKEVLSLRNIIDCQRKKTKEEGKFYIQINFKDKMHLYRLDSLKVCNIWIEEINKCYCKFWINLEKQYSDVQAFLCTIKQDLYEIDYLTGETRKVDLNSNKKESNNNSLNNNNNLKNEKKIKNVENSLIIDSNVGIDSFDILDILCLGNFGKVYKVRFKLNREIFIMKVLNKKYLIKNNLLKFAIDESNTFKQLVSPFIITLRYSFQTSENLYLISDFCSGGDLNFHIMHTLFDEEEAKFYIAEIILAIEYLHKAGLSYKNLNFENIFISSDNHIKLGDFDLVKDGEEGNSQQNLNETKGTGKPADIYGIGEILYEMICGTSLFYYSNFKSNIKNKIRELVFHDYFSDELKDLLNKLLCKDPNRRIGLFNKVELKNHPWFKDIDWDKLSRKSIEPPLNLVLMKKEIEENINYINSDNKNEIIEIDNEIKENDLNEIKNDKIIENKKEIDSNNFSENKLSNFLFNSLDNNII